MTAKEGGTSVPFFLPLIMARKITLDQFLKPEEIQQALDLYKAHRATPTRFHKEVVDKIIRPNIRRINADLGQQNDPNYLGYAVEYVFDRTTG